MKLSDILMFLNGETDSSNFKKKIKPEVDKYRKLHEKKGSSIPIILTEDSFFNFELKHLELLIFDFIEGKLNYFETSYIIEALLLSSKVEFETKELVEILDTFCDFEEKNKTTTDALTNMISDLPK